MLWVAPLSQVVVFFVFILLFIFLFTALSEMLPCWQSHLRADSNGFMCGACSFFFPGESDVVRLGCVDEKMLMTSAFNSFCNNKHAF